MITFVAKTTEKESFLVGNRRLGTIPIALSLSATWIWAPALFVSAEQAYMNGLVGLLWFTVPNILCLLLFIPFAVRLRRKLPRGYTLSELMGQSYSNRVKNIYLFQLSGLALLSTIVQLVAGGKIVALLTGFPFWLTTIILGFFAFSYSVKSGIKGSVYTDGLQMILIIVALLIFAPWTVNISGFGAVTDGLSGIVSDSVNFFDSHGLYVFLSFGLPTAIGLIAGPFGDQNFWQRVLSVRQSKLKKSIMLGAIFFAIVPLLMGILGFVSAGTGFTADDQSVINLEIVTALLPSWTVIIFMFMLLSGLLSTIDSNLLSISSLTNDVKKRATLKDFRMSMLILIVISILLSNIPLSIIDFFLIYGILRATTFMTTVLTLLDVKLHEKGVFYGV